MEDLLYLDTARIGQISPSAALACSAVTKLANDDPRQIFDEVVKVFGDAENPSIPCWQGQSEFRRSMLECLNAGDEKRLIFASHSAALVKLVAQSIFLASSSVFCTDLIWPRYKTVLSRQAKRASKQLTVLPIRDFLKFASKANIVEKVATSFLESQCEAIYLTGVSSDGFKLPIDEIIERIEAEREIRFVAVDGSQEFAQGDHSNSCRVADIYLFSCHKWLGGYHPLSVGLYGNRRTRDYLEVTISRMIKIGAIEDPLLRFQHGRNSCNLQETVNLLPLLSASGALNDLLASSKPLEEMETLNISNRNVICDAVSQTNWAIVNDVLDSGLHTRILTFRNPDGQAWPRYQFEASLRSRGIACSTYENGDVRLSLPDRELSAREVTRIGDFFHGIV